MTDADDTTSLHEQLATHRHTLAILLRQVATHTEAYAPPAQLSGIADARAAIARLKAALRVAGAVVEEQAGDVAPPDAEPLSPDAAAQPLSAISGSTPQRNQRFHPSAQSAVLQPLVLTQKLRTLLRSF